MFLFMHICIRESARERERETDNTHGEAYTFNIRCTHVYVYVCAYINIYVHAYIHTYMYIYIHIHISTHTRGQTHTQTVMDGAHTDTQGAFICAT